MKCAGVGVENFSKNTHVWCGSVRSEKILCAECAGVPELAAHKYSGKNLFSLLVILVIKKMDPIRKNCFTISYFFCLCKITCVC